MADKDALEGTMDGLEDVAEEILDLPDAGDVSEEMQALLATVDDLNEAVEELAAERDALAAKLAASSETESKLAAAEAQCVELRGLVDALQARLDEYERYQRAELVEEVIRLRIDLGKLAEEGADGARALLEQRSVESLRDTIADLKSEAPTFEVPAAPPHIETMAIPGEKNATIEGVDETPELTREEILEKGLSLLLTGWRR